MQRDEIWIIGTEPPCPRCDYLTRMVQDIVNTLGLTVGVRHLAYTSNEAHRFAASLGLVPGTAKEVARKASVDVDWDRIHTLIDEPDWPPAAERQSACCPTAAAKWSPALDEALRPCEHVARDVGIMMTPALVFGGRLLHQGSVPDRRKVSVWLQQYCGSDADLNHWQLAVEVLGLGCEKCDTLYKNVLQAVAQSGLGDLVSVQKRTDLTYFQEMGVLITPALVVNRIVVSKGKMLTPDQVANQLNNHLPA